MNDRSPEPKPLRERLRALAANAILDAAEQVFAEQGLQAGMDAIATRAGVAVGTLYNHFGDRDRLIQALLEARSTELIASVDAAAIAAENLPFREQLRAVVVAVVDGTEVHASFRRMVFQSEIQTSNSRRLSVGEALVKRIGTAIRRGHDEGLVRPDPEGVLPVMLLGLLHGALMLHLRAPERLPSERVADVVIRQFLDGASGVAS